MSMSTRWAEVDCDFGVWLLLPREIPPDLWPDDLSWAMDQAQAVWDDSGLRHRRRDVKNLVTLLLNYRSFMAGRAWSHMAYLHMPDPRMEPLAASVSVWRAQGERDDALRFYTGADLPGTDGPPEVAEFPTEHLGAGLRAMSRPATLRPSADAEEASATVLSYAWRVEDDTDVSLFLLSPDAARLREAVPDVDAFARGIRVVPDPEGEGAADEEEDEVLIEAPSYLHVLDRMEELTGEG
ncbi:hypothetical protein [Actinomadura rugatobispora]|uniref:Uncharacterized protein n=1 Tax=Actinomadura rugatobispora TaxID=1994 RepID=A0ABW1A6A1_9ACTN